MEHNWIKKVTLENIGPFEGTQTIEFKEGLNIIVGPGMSGKTRLLSHISGLVGHHLLFGWGTNLPWKIILEMDDGIVEVSERKHNGVIERIWKRPEGWRPWSTSHATDIPGHGPWAHYYMLLGEESVERLKSFNRHINALLPQGWENCGRGEWESLSSGHRDAVTIAAVLALEMGKNEVLLLDEPFARLDKELRGKVLGLLSGMPSQVIAVTKHEMEWPGANVIRLKRTANGETQVMKREGTEAGQWEQGTSSRTSTPPTR